VNFNVNFNVLLSKYIVHGLVKIKRTLMISRCTVQLRKFSVKYLSIPILGTVATTENLCSSKHKASQQIRQK